MTGERAGPLAGVRVIELAHIMAGPVCGLMLTDLGADVIKVERVPGGDDSRRTVPPELGGESAAFLMMNRYKRGIALDLKQESARAVLRRLIRSADMLIENYRRDTMTKLGLGYDALKAENAGLVYCEISGFGRTGPYADRGGFDLMEHPKAGRTEAIGLPIKLSATPGRNRRPAPLLGQHTREVLAEAGYGAAETEVLARSGAAICAGP